MCQTDIATTRRITSGTLSAKLAPGLVAAKPPALTEPFRGGSAAGVWRMGWDSNPR